jgi:hypothetical protein
MENFDDLYNEYFSNSGDGMDKLNKIIDEHFNSEDVNKIHEILEDLNLGNAELSNLSISSDEKALENIIDDYSKNIPDEDSLGEPNSRKVIINNGVVLEELRWDTSFGTVIKIIVKGGVDGGDIIELPKENVLELSLEDKLLIAEKREDYEECAKIKKEIESKK